MHIISSFCSCCQIQACYPHSSIIEKTTESTFRALFTCPTWIWGSQNLDDLQSSTSEDAQTVLCEMWNLKKETFCARKNGSKCSLNRNSTQTLECHKSASNQSYMFLGTGTEAPLVKASVNEMRPEGLLWDTIAYHWSSYLANKSTKIICFLHPNFCNSSFAHTCLQQ